MGGLKIRLIGVASILSLLMGLLALPSPVAAQGVTVVTGLVTVDGALAPAGLTVQVSLTNGSVIGVGMTGNAGLLPNQYRVDVQSVPSLEGQTIVVQAVLNGTASPATGAPTVTFAANRVLTANVAACTMGGVTVVTGTVAIDGQPAPAGTTVQVSLQDGTVIGTGVTGAGGLASDQYRIDMQATACLESQTIVVQAVLDGVPSPTAGAPTATFRANMVLFVNVATFTVTGVTIVTGTVAIDGQPAPAGTTVQVSLPNGAVIGTVVTGAGGLASDQYRIDMQATAILEGQTIVVQALLNVVPSPAAGAPTATFRTNRVLRVTVAATTVTLPVPAEDALAPLISTGALEMVSSFNYETGLFEGFVPDLPDNPSMTISPNSVVVITTMRDMTVVLSGIAFPIRADTPTPVPVGAVVTFAIQD